MEKVEISKLIWQTNDANNWISKKIYLQFNGSQYKALLAGYHPHWDMRYGIHFEDGYFYNYRSGWIVGKFKVEMMEDDMYQVTEMYDNPEKCDWKVVFESLGEACNQNHVRLDSEFIYKMFERTEKMQKKNSIS